MRLAWFTPLPPTRSGIADYCAELLPALGDHHSIDVFVASSGEGRWAAERALPYAVRDAHEFVWRHHTGPYDLTVFQLGNAWCHDYMWPYVFHYPGLVVLHDGSLHHARAWSLLRRQRAAHYRAELLFDHPTLAASAAELALGGFAGPIYYFWPMLRSVVESARAVAVHSTRLADELRSAHATATIARVRMGVPAPVASDAAVRGLRRQLGLSPDTLVLAAFGAVTEEKRLGAVLRTLHRLRRERATVHLLLVGQTMPQYDVRAEAQANGVADAVTVVGFTEAEALATYLRLADVALCLRWPTARETSASWLRAIAAGRPTLVTDLAHQVDVPTLDPRTWGVLHAEPTLTAPEPVGISIDLLDEDHSLLLALRRLVRDPSLRAALGAAAARHWATHHTIAHMARDYTGVLEDARRRRIPTGALPSHLRPDPLIYARALLQPFGVPLDPLF